MPIYTNYCAVIAYGPFSETSSFLSVFDEALEAAGFEKYVEPTFHDTGGKDMTFLEIRYTEPDGSHFEVSDLIARFPKLRFLLVKAFESAFFLTKVVRHRHDRGFNCCLIDDTFKRGIPDCEYLPIENAIADDLIEEVSNDPDLAFAFSLIYYPLGLLDDFARGCA